MHCVRCQSDMQKKAFKGVLIDHCATCRGVWLDHGELDALANDEQKDQSTLQAAAYQETLEDASRPMTILSACPKCQTGRIMEKLFENVKVDYCTACKGLFFDHGELETALKNKQKQGFLGRVRDRLLGGLS